MEDPDTLITQHLLGEEAAAAISIPRSENEEDDEVDQVLVGGHDIEAPLLAGDVVPHAGVRKIGAVSSSWTRNELLVAYICVFAVFFVNSYQQQTTGNLSAYVTSEFNQLEMLSSVSVVSSVIGGVVKLPIATLIDVWGRMEGYVLMVSLTVIGLIMIAVCNNIETYAAAQVFYTVGCHGLTYVLTVFIADTSSLRNRGLMFAFANTPFIFTTFVGPATAQYFYENYNWRWGHGIWAVIMPACSFPFVVILARNQRKAALTGRLRSLEQHKRNLRQSLIYYFWDIDVVGMLLLCASLTLILLSLNLASGTPKEWRSPAIITMLVIGFVCFIAFGLHEKFLAPRAFLPTDHLLDRTIVGACALSCTTFVSFYCWDLYFRAYLQVVHNQTISTAGLIANIFNIGSCLWGVVVGIAVRRTNRFKWLALYIGVPLYLLGTAMMIRFRSLATNDIGYIIVCQVLVAIAGGTLVITLEMAVMAVSPSHGIAGVLAFLGLFSSLGAGVGQAVSGAIYSGTLPWALERFLPEELKSKAAQIAGSLVKQLEYPMGTPERAAIIEAVSYTQKRLAIAGTMVMLVGFVWVSMWKDVKVSDARGAGRRGSQASLLRERRGSRID